MSVSSLLSRLKSSWKTLVVLFAIALVPLIYAGTLIWSNIDPASQLDQIPAAIVNDDVPATPDAPGATQVHLGEALTNELIDNDARNNFSWQEMAADEAASALRGGDVLVVLTIPEDFSAGAVSTASDDPKSATTSKLSITTNDSANLVVGNIAQTVGTAVTDALATQVSAEYLENIYLGFTRIHDTVSEAADGAAELSDGAGAASAGSAELVVGLTDLKAGSSALAGGAATLSTGAATADRGAQQIASGAAAVDDGAQRLAAGASSASEAAQRIAAGLRQMQDKLTGLPAHLDALADGSAALTEGAQAASAGATDLADGAHTLADHAGSLAVAIDSTHQASQSVQKEASSAAEGASTLSSGLDQLVADYDALTDAQRQERLSELATRARSVSGNAASVSSGTKGLVGSAQSGSGLAYLSAAARPLAAGGTDLATGASTLAAGTLRLADGATAVSSGVATLDSMLAELADKIAEASAGAGRLAAGAADVRNGIDSLAEGTANLSTGANTLAANTPALAAGGSSLADGTSALSSGLTAATDGATTLDDGLTRLADGTHTLATGLTQGVDAIPTYTDQEAEHLADVASTPIQLQQERLNEAPKNGYGLAPYFMTLSLWVGALAFYLMMPAISDRVLNGRRPAWLAGPASLLPGALMAIVQSVLMLLIIRFGLGIEPANMPGLLALTMLTSLTFVAINQACIALLDAPGRFLALIFIVLQLSAAGGTYPIQTSPAFFQAIHGWLPLSHAVGAFRSLIAGGDLGVAPAVGVITAWLVASVAITSIGIWRRRRTAQSTAA